MPARIGEIRRYWTPIDASASAENFDLDDNDWFRLVIAPKTRRLDELEQVPCLILLGEPGLGKSTSVRVEVDRLCAAQREHTSVHLVDLAMLSSDAALDSIFRGGPVAIWRNNESELFLYLDSYDECLRHYPALRARLFHLLAELPRDRLRIRIASRYGEFIVPLIESLNTLWPTVDNGENESLQTLRLEPLSRSSVAAWATDLGVDSQAFLREVDRRNARSFVARPITLDPLVKQYRRGQFPQTEVALFEASIHSLCREVNRDRIGDLHLTDRQRFVVAERIAAFCTLSGKDTIWLDAPELAPENSLRLQDIVGDNERSDGIPFAIDQHAVYETLGTGLFGVHDPFTVRWTQQVYREFLTARYFARRFTDTQAIIQFFEHSNHPEYLGRRISPQLAEPTAWLASMNEAVSSWLLTNDPIILLTAAHHVPEQHRASLIDWWLHAEASGQELYVRLWAQHVQDHLIHAGLADQLAPWITNGDAPRQARALAVDLAGASQLQDLHGAILSVARTVQESTELRWRATRALVELEADESNGQLATVLDEAGEDDTASDRLKVFALRLLWPEFLSTQQTLDVLKRLKISDQDEFGQSFEPRFIQQLTPAQMVEALEWFQEHLTEHFGIFETLFGRVVTRAAEMMQDNDVLTSLAALLSYRVSNYYYFAGNEYPVRNALTRQPEAIRLQFAEALARLLGDRTPHELAPWVVNLALPYAHMLERTLHRPADECLWFESLRQDPRTYRDPNVRQSLDGLAATANREMLIRVRDLFAADTDHFASDRLVPNEFLQTRASRQLETRRDIVARLIQAAEERLSWAWNELGKNLYFDETSQNWTRESVLAISPGWIESTEETKAHIKAIALQYLHEVPQRHPNWQWDDVIRTAGFEALLLILDVQSASLADLSADEWIFWLPTIITRGSNFADPGYLQRLTHEAYHRAPQQVANAVGVLFTIKESWIRAHDIMIAIEPCWDERLAAALNSVLLSSPLPPTGMRAVLEILLRHNDEQAAAAARSWYMHTDEYRDRAQIAAEQILLHGNDELLEPLLDFMNEHVEIAREIYLAAAPQDSYRRVPRQPLAPNTGTRIYLSMVDLFPPADDYRSRQGVRHKASPRDVVAEMRDRVLRDVSRSRSWESLTAIESVIACRHDLRLPHVLKSETEDALLRATWECWRDPRVVMQVAAEQQLLIVRDADQLLDLVIASLKRLQHELTQGAVADCWSGWKHDGKWRYRPKPELDLSDFIKRFLDRDLAHYAVVANREVENRQGDETDILVQFVGAVEERSTISVVIEVKGCWHPELLTSMEHQLAQRYLTHHQASRGVYVVGWFNCGRWDREDYRRGRSAGLDLATLRKGLSQQATVLTNQQRRIEAVVLDCQWL